MPAGQGCHCAHKIPGLEFGAFIDKDLVDSLDAASVEKHTGPAEEPNYGPRLLILYNLGDG